MTTICLLPVANDARILRRLAALRSRGIETEVLAFERADYPGEAPARGYRRLGRIEHGHFGRRLVALLRALPAVRAAVAHADVVYAFGLDLHALAWIAARTSGRRPSLVYEVADIHPTLVGTRPMARLMRTVERRLLRDTRLVVVTSEAFITGFYRGVQKLARLPHLLIENKPNLESVARPAPRRARTAVPLTIGYFGILRCQRSWEALRQIAVRGNGRVRVYLRGVPLGLPDFEREVADTPWVEYGGPYVAPNDLPAMFDRIDLSWNAHRVDDNNSLLWNRTNRFYEACAFQTPMVAQVGSQDGGVVAARGIGTCIDLGDVEAAVNQVLQITDADVDRWRSGMERLPRSIYTENGEHAELARRILALAHVA